jgi:hypothetical protein
MYVYTKTHTSLHIYIYIYIHGVLTHTRSFLYYLVYVHILLLKIIQEGVSLFKSEREQTTCSRYRLPERLLQIVLWIQKMKAKEAERESSPITDLILLRATRFPVQCLATAPNITTQCSRQARRHVSEIKGTIWLCVHSVRFRTTVLPTSLNLSVCKARYFAWRNGVHIPGICFIFNVYGKMEKYQVLLLLWHMCT